MTAKEGKALKGEHIKKVIGYAFLPLLQDGRILDESYHLPVMTSLQPHYLLSKDEWKVRGKAVFTLNARTVSSLYTNNPFVNKFLTLAQIPLEAQVMPSEESKKYAVCLFLPLPSFGCRSHVRCLSPLYRKTKLKTAPSPTPSTK